MKKRTIYKLEKELLQQRMYLVNTNLSSNTLIVEGMKLAVMYEIVKALYDIGFNGPIRPDHGRMMWGEKAMPGYGLYDRALGAAYLRGLWEAAEKESK